MCHCLFINIKPDNPQVDPMLLVEKIHEWEMGYTAHRVCLSLLNHYIKTNFTHLFMFTVYHWLLHHCQLSHHHISKVIALIKAYIVPSIQHENEEGYDVACHEGYNKVMRLLQFSILKLIEIGKESFLFCFVLVLLVLCPICGGAGLAADTFSIPELGIGTDYI